MKWIYTLDLGHLFRVLKQDTFSFSLPVYLWFSLSAAIPAAAASTPAAPRLIVLDLLFLFATIFEGKSFCHNLLRLHSSNAYSVAPENKPLPSTRKCKGNCSLATGQTENGFLKFFHSGWKYVRTNFKGGSSTKYWWNVWAGVVCILLFLYFKIGLKIQVFLVLFLLKCK